MKQHFWKEIFRSFNPQSPKNPLFCKNYLSKKIIHVFHRYGYKELKVQSGIKYDKAI
jgi:hypothetical protein